MRRAATSATMLRTWNVVGDDRTAGAEPREPRSRRLPSGDDLDAGSLLDAADEREEEACGLEGGGQDGGSSRPEG